MRVLSCRYWENGCFVCLILACHFALGSEVGTIDAFHRSGQTFVTWPEMAGHVDIRYLVYRDSEPILFSRTEDAELLASLGPDSGRYRYVPFDKFTCADYRPPMQTIVPDAEPLEEGTGLFVHTVPIERESYYAISALDLDGKCIFFASTAKSIEEGPGFPEPIMLRSCQHPENHAFRHEFAHWATPNMCHIEGYPFQFTVATKTPEILPSRQYVLVFALHGHGGSWDRQGYPLPGEDNLVLSPSCSYDFLRAKTNSHSWWSGYVPSRVDSSSEDDAWHYYDGYRLKYYYDWCVSSWQVNRGKSWIWGGSMGGMGALNFAMEYPDVFPTVRLLVPILSPENSAEWIKKSTAYLYGAASSASGSHWNKISPVRRILSGEIPPLILGEFALFDEATPFDVTADFLALLESRRLPGVGVVSECGHAFDRSKGPPLDGGCPSGPPYVILSDTRILGRGLEYSSSPMKREAGRFRGIYLGEVEQESLSGCTFVVSPALEDYEGKLCIADITLRGLTSFPVSSSLKYSCHLESHPDRIFPVRVIDEERALTIENVPIGQETRFILTNERTD